MAGGALYDPETVLLFHEKKKYESVTGWKLWYYAALALWLFAK